MTSDLDEAIRLLRALKPFGPLGSNTFMLFTDDLNAMRRLLARHPEPPKLLNCPFCGGMAIHWCLYGKCRVECAGCGAKVTREEISTVDGSAIAAWNRRTP